MRGRDERTRGREEDRWIGGEEEMREEERR